MFWRSFNFAGLGCLMLIEGMMSSDKCIDVIENKVIPDMKRAFPDGGGILPQDFAPCHSSKKVKTIFRKYNLNVLEWPGNSPELNPIGNLLAITKSRLQKFNCTTMTKLIEAII